MIAFLMLWTALLLVMPLVAWQRARAAAGQALPPAIPNRPTLLVRPCAGTPPWLAQALRSTADAPLAGTLLIRFTVDAATDPALPIAEAAAVELRARGLDARVMVASHPGANRKAAQVLACVAAHPDAAQVVVADADVDLASAPLDALCAHLHASDVAAAWQPVVESLGDTAGDRASAALLGASLHAFPLLGRLDPGGLVGKLFAFDRARVDAARGLEAGLTVLGEDMALAAAVEAQGLRVVQHPGAARSLARGRAMDDLVARYARWLQVIRTQRGGRLWAYPALFLGHAHIGVAGLFVATFEPAGGLSVVAGALLARLLAAGVARHLGGAQVRPSLGDLVAADVLLFRAWRAALRSREVVWAGRRLQRGPGGAWLSDADT
jgi:ceramide glucosyltransferase